MLEEKYEFTRDDLSLVTNYLLSRYQVLGLDMDGSCVNNEYIHHDVAVNLLIDHLPGKQKSSAYEDISWSWWFDNLGSGQKGEGSIYDKFKKKFPDFSLEEYDFAARWSENYKTEVSQLSADKLDGFECTDLKLLVKIFNDAGRYHALYSVSEETMVAVNKKAIDLNPTVTISGDDIRKNGLKFKPSADGWILAQKSLPSIIPADQWLILEDTNKGVNAVLKFGADAIQACDSKQYPHPDARYSFPTKTSVLRPLWRAAQDEQKDQARQKILVPVPANYALNLGLS
jgi:beta-phosphoglucomutase-like phosphatase (HAD superfamily)